MVFLMRKEPEILECSPFLHCTKEGDPLCFLLCVFIPPWCFVEAHREELGIQAVPHCMVEHSWPLGIWGNVGWFLVTCVVATPFQSSAQRYSSHFFSWEGILTLGGSAPNRLEEFRIVGLRISWPRRRILFGSTVFENHILETAGFSTQVLSWKEVRKLSYF